VDALLQRIAAAQPLFLHELFADAADREEIILIFIAMLELVRLQAVRVSQAEIGGPVLCSATEVFLAGGQAFRDKLLASILGEDPTGPADAADSAEPDEPAAEAAPGA